MNPTSVNSAAPKMDRGSSRLWHVLGPTGGRENGSRKPAHPAPPAPRRTPNPLKPRGNPLNPLSPLLWHPLKGPNAPKNFKQTRLAGSGSLRDARGAGRAGLAGFLEALMGLGADGEPEERVERSPAFCCWTNSKCPSRTRHGTRCGSTIHRPCQRRNGNRQRHYPRTLPGVAVGPIRRERHRTPSGYDVCTMGPHHVYITCSPCQQQKLADDTMGQRGAAREGASLYVRTATVVTTQINVPPFQPAAAKTKASKA